MDSRSRAFAVAAFAVSVPLAYVVVHVLGLPMLWLDPEAMRWSFGARPSPLAMDFYGRGGVSLLIGLCVALLSARASRVTRSTAVVSFAAVAIAAAIFAGVAFEVMRLVPSARPVRAEVATSAP